MECTKGIEGMKKEVRVFKRPMTPVPFELEQMSEVVHSRCERPAAVYKDKVTA